MRKSIFFVLLLLIIFAPLQRAAAADLTLKASGQGEWKILSPSGAQIGTLRSMEEGAFSVQLPNGAYFGIILRGGDFKKPGRHAAISPDDARFYLDVWQAIQKMQ
ncbi:MAG: hypothetical protein WAW37_16700 [Syntrophobacteraceae bacterium]